MSYGPRRTSTPIDLCVSLSVATIVNLLLFLEDVSVDAVEFSSQTFTGCVEGPTQQF